MDLSKYKKRVATKKAYRKFRREKYEESLVLYNNILETYPEHTNAWFGKALVLEAMGKLEDALKFYDKTLEQDPKYFGTIGEILSLSLKGFLRL